MVIDDDNQFNAWKNPAPEGVDQPSQELTETILQTEPDVLITGKISASQKAVFTAQNINVLEDRTGSVLELLDEVRGQ